MFSILQVDRALAAAACKLAAQQHEEQWSSCCVTAGTLASAVVHVPPQSRKTTAPNIRLSLAVQSLLPDVAIPDKAAAPKGPTVASAEFIACLTAKSGNIAPSCSLPGQIAGSRSCYMSSQMHTMPLRLPSSVAAGCRHSAAKLIAAQLGTLLPKPGPGRKDATALQSSSSHCCMQHGSRLCQTGRIGHAGAPAAAAAPIAGTLEAASMAAAAARLQIAAAGSYVVHLPHIGRQGDPSPSSAQEPALAPAEGAMPAQPDHQTDQQPGGVCSKAAVAAAATTLDTYFDSIDKAGKLDTPQEDISAALELGFAKAVAAGGLQATASSMASVAVQLAGLLGVAASDCGGSPAVATVAMAGSAVESTWLQQAAQEGPSASLRSTLSRAATDATTGRTSKVPQLWLQQQQAYSRSPSSRQPGSPRNASAAAAAAQQSCCSSLPVLGSAGSAVEGIMKISSPRSSRFACPGSILQAPLPAVTDADATASNASLRGRPVVGATGSYIPNGQPGKTVGLFGALPAIGSPRGVGYRQAGGLYGGSTSSCGAGAAYLKRTAKVPAQEQAEPGPGIILAPWKDQQHVKAAAAVAAAAGLKSGQRWLEQIAAESAAEPLST